MIFHHASNTLYKALRDIRGLFIAKVTAYFQGTSYLTWDTTYGWEMLAEIFIREGIRLTIQMKVSSGSSGKFKQKNNSKFSEIIHLINIL